MPARDFWNMNDGHASNANIPDAGYDVLYPSQLKGMRRGLIEC